MTHCFQITYTSMLDGCRHTYMNIGFESKESAEHELCTLMRDAKKFRKNYPNWDPSKIMLAGFHITAASVGKYWRIKKVFYKRNNKK